LLQRNFRCTAGAGFEQKYTWDRIYRNRKGVRIMAVMARIGRLFRGLLGLFISGIEERNPEALMEAARQEFRDKMAQYNTALARMAGIAERLKTQVKTRTVRAQELERRILANHRAGNLELAGSLARELQELKGDLNTDTQELAETEEAYQANLRQAKLAQKEFEDKVRKLEKQLSQVKIKEAQAEAAAALGSAAFKVGDLGDTMKTVEDILAKRYEQSAGKARVAKDLVDLEDVAEKENERKALEQAALADFLASQGIQAPAQAEAPEASKEIGPKQ
jgi:phage shock protein A